MERAGCEGYWKQEMIDQPMAFHRLGTPGGLIYLSSTTNQALSIVVCILTGVLTSGRLGK